LAKVIGVCVTVTPAVRAARDPLRHELAEAPVDLPLLLRSRWRSILDTGQYP